MSYVGEGTVKSKYFILLVSFLMSWSWVVTCYKSSGP